MRATDKTLPRWCGDPAIISYGDKCAASDEVIDHGDVEAGSLRSAYGLVPAARFRSGPCRVGTETAAGEDDSWRREVRKYADSGRSREYLFRIFPREDLCVDRGRRQLLGDRFVVWRSFYHSADGLMGDNRTGNETCPEAQT